MLTYFMKMKIIILLYCDYLEDYELEIIMNYR